ncbi:hypothetical protein DET47_104129 [Shewanella putrefaciens]|nr:hypothetical protein DET47_104129 [Shewanella putrefaciens]
MRKVPLMIQNAGDIKLIQLRQNNSILAVTFVEKMRLVNYFNQLDSH